MNRKLHAIVRIFVAAVFCTAGAARVRAQGGPPATPVVVSAATERDLPASIRLVGTVVADKSALVASEVDGPIAIFDAQEGKFLRKGETICQVDPVMAGLRADEARGRLESLKAKLHELELGTRIEELQRWQATVEEAQAVFDKWEFEKRRIASLFQKDQSSEKERYDTEMEHLAASRRLAQYTAMLEEAKNGPRPETLGQARFDVAAQQAVLKRLERDLDRTVIKAPFDGFVAMKRTEVGEWIKAGSPVCDMVAVEVVRIRVDVPESTIPFAKAGEPATVEIEALGRTLSGTITRVIPRATAAARTFPVEIDVPNADHTLLPGMFVWAHVPAGPAGKRVMVTKDAIVSRGTSKQIFVIRAGEKDARMAMPMSVTTGLEQAGEIEIKGGDLKAGDLVVTRNNERLFGPTPVALTQSTSQPSSDSSATQ